MKEYWIISPEEKSVQVFLLDGDFFRPHEVYSATDIAKVNSLDGCFIELSKVFTDDRIVYGVLYRFHRLIFPFFCAILYFKKQFISGGLKMSPCNTKELEFCVFLINALADDLGLLTPAVYKKLNDSRILDDYIIPFYDVLHTLGEEYLLQDIVEEKVERQ